MSFVSSQLRNGIHCVLPTSCQRQLQFTLPPQSPILVPFDIVLRKHGRLAWASRKYHRYASGSKREHRRDVQTYKRLKKSQEIYTYKCCTCYSVCIVAAEQLSSHILWVFVVVRHEAQLPRLYSCITGLLATVCGTIMDVH